MVFSFVEVLIWRFSTNFWSIGVLNEVGSLSETKRQQRKYKNDWDVLWALEGKFWHLQGKKKFNPFIHDSLNIFLMKKTNRKLSHATSHMTWRTKICAYAGWRVCSCWASSLAMDSLHTIPKRTAKYLSSTFSKGSSAHTICLVFDSEPINFQLADLFQISPSQRSLCIVLQQKYVDLLWTNCLKRDRPPVRMLVWFVPFPHHPILKCQGTWKHNNELFRRGKLIRSHKPVKALDEHTLSSSYKTELVGCFRRVSMSSCFIVSSTLPYIFLHSWISSFFACLIYCPS